VEADLNPHLQAREKNERKLISKKETKTRRKSQKRLMSKKQGGGKSKRKI